MAEAEICARAMTLAQIVLDFLQQPEAEDAAQAAAIQRENALGPAVIRQMLIAGSDPVAHAVFRSS